MDKRNINNWEDQSFSELRKKREAEIASLRKKYGKRKNWPEIEKLLWTADVDTPFVKTTLASDFLKHKDTGQGEKTDTDKDPDLILSELQENSSLKSSYYQSGMATEDLEKYDGLINELFTKKQIKNRAYFKAFLTCDDMESIANRAGYTKQYIQKLFHEKAIEFVNSEKFIAITKDIVVKHLVAQEITAQSDFSEDGWDQLETGQVLDFDERAQRAEKKYAFKLSEVLKDITPGKLKELMPCGIDKESTDGR